MKAVPRIALDAEITLSLTLQEARVFAWLMGFDPKHIVSATTTRFTEEELGEVAIGVRSELERAVQIVDDAQKRLSGRAP